MGHERAFLKGLSGSAEGRVKFPLHNSSTWYPLICPSFHDKLPFSLLHHDCRMALSVCRRLSRTAPHCTERVDLFEASTCTPTVKKSCFPAHYADHLPLDLRHSDGWVTNVSRWSGASQREVTCASPQLSAAQPLHFYLRPSSHWGLLLLFRNHTYFKGRAPCCRRVVDQG